MQVNRNSAFYAAAWFACAAITSLAAAPGAGAQEQDAPDADAPGYEAQSALQEAEVDGAVAQEAEAGEAALEALGVVLSGLDGPAETDDLEDEESPAEEEGELIDPFSYNMPANSGEFMPYAEGTVPAGIEVAGIAVPERGEPLAALFIPGHVSLFYVRTGDIIAVNVVNTSTKASQRFGSLTSSRRLPQAQSQPAATPPTPTKRTGRSRAAKIRANQARRETTATPAAPTRPAQLLTTTTAPTLSEEVCYIEVGDITDQQVELHPVMHPENVRILR